MRSTITLLLLVGFSIYLGAQDAIKFKKNLPLKVVLAQARSKKKIVFIDAYTTWCGPCKMMDRDVFTDESVAAYYNDNFINVKIDMEQKEGPKIAQTYKVRGYPSFLFLDGDGEIIHRGIGYMDGLEFLELGATAIGDNSMKSLGDQFESRKKDPDFLYDYASLLIGLGESDRADKVVAAFLEIKEDWSEERAMELIFGSPGSIDSKRMAYIVENANQFKTMVGASEFINTLQDKFVQTQIQNQGKRMMPSEVSMNKLYTAHAAQLKDQLSKHFTMMSAENRRDIAEYSKAAIIYFDEYPSDNSNELNSVAWTFYENVKDKDQLLKAVAWAKMSVELDKGYANLDTLAWLYHKTGQTELAKEIAKEAIEIAKATGQKYSETAKLLN